MRKFYQLATFYEGKQGNVTPLPRREVLCRLNLVRSVLASQR